MVPCKSIDIAELKTDELETKGVEELKTKEDGMNSIGGGVPMDLQQLKEYLQKHCRVPVALQLQGTTGVKCPFCLKIHDHDKDGHVMALCDSADHETVVIGERHFVANYGYTIFGYTDDNQLIVPENMLRHFKPRI